MKEKKKKRSKNEEEIDLENLIREEEKSMTKEQIDDMQDYVEFMTGTGRYADRKDRDR